MEYFCNASVISNPCDITPIARPPTKLITVIINPAVASPFTYFEAPSIAPKKVDSSWIFWRRSLACSSVIAPVFKSASIAICLPGMASNVKRAVTSDTRSEPLLITINCTMIKIKNTIPPTIRFPPPTNSPNAWTTLPASPFSRIFLVDPTFNEIRNNVVISSNVGKLDIFNASVENSALNNINNAIARFSIIKISSKNNGIGIIKKMIGTRIYNPSIKSVRFIMYLL